MSYTFKMTLNGLEVEVNGEFSPAEPQTLTDPGCPAEFYINTIKPVGNPYDVGSMTDEEHEKIEQAAFKAATDEVGEY